jgi:hypothetical protein
VAAPVHRRGSGDKTRLVRGQTFFQSLEEYWGGVVLEAATRGARFPVTIPDAAEPAR